MTSNQQLDYIKQQLEHEIALYHSAQALQSKGSVRLYGHSSNTRRLCNGSNRNL